MALSKHEVMLQYDFAHHEASQGFVSIANYHMALVVRSAELSNEQLKLHIELSAKVLAGDSSGNIAAFIKHMRIKYSDTYKPLNSLMENIKGGNDGAVPM